MKSESSKHGWNILHEQLVTSFGLGKHISRYFYYQFWWIYLLKREPNLILNLLTTHLGSPSPFHNSSNWRSAIYLVYHAQCYWVISVYCIKLTLFITICLFITELHFLHKYISFLYLFGSDFIIFVIPFCTMA